jgi:3-hydroxybutyryl-CoA dehydrogenase
MEERNRIGILGAGIIGAGLAQSAAASGHEVVLVDVTPQALSRARQELARSVPLQRLLGGPAVRLEQVLERITFSLEVEDLSEVPLLLEAIPEIWETKKAVWGHLGELCPAGSLLASATSAIPITRLAALVPHPERVVGLHFMNPVPLKATVEMIRGFHTSEQTLQSARNFLAGLGKTAIEVADSPGFVSNRVLMLTVNEAICLVAEGVAAPEDIDRLFKGCFSHKMGPLETADMIGLDTVLHSLEVLMRDLGEKFRPCPLLRRMVEAGRLGRKSGQGFFVHPGLGGAS